MTKIMFFELVITKKDALNWGKEHNVEVVTSEEILSEDTVDQLEGFDGVTTMQFGKLADSVYPKLENTVLNKSLNVLLVLICMI